MSRTRTLTNLTADVRLYSGVGTGQVVTDAQIMRLLNESIYAVGAVLESFSPNRYYTARTTGIITAGLASIAIPAAAARILYISYVDGTAEVEINRGTSEEIRLRETASLSWKTTSPIYWLEDALIKFSPAPSESMTVCMYHSSYSIGCKNTGGTDINELATGTDTYDGRFGLETWVVLDTAMRVKIIQEEDPSGLAKLRDETLNRLMPFLTERVSLANQRINSAKVPDYYRGYNR
jgi:hypothetical protein